MIEDVIHLLQRISSIWLALSVIYPIVSRNILSNAQHNDMVKYHQSSKASTRPTFLVQLALVTLALTIMDLLMSVF